MDGREMPPPTLPIKAWAGEREDPEVIQEGELSLALISCSTWESGPYTTLGQHSRVSPKGVRVGEPTLRPAPPLVHRCKG